MTVCSCVTTNESLKAWVRFNGRLEKCDFCGLAGQQTVDLVQLLEHIDSVVRRHYSPNLDNPKNAENATKLIQRLAGVGGNIAAKVQQVVHKDESPDEPRFYDYGPLVFSAPVLGKYWKLWCSLKSKIKFQARFCGTDTREILDTLIGDMKSFCKGAGIRCLSPGEKICRARVTRDVKQALEWFSASDDGALRAPHEPRANRMNAAGIRAFYGALQEHIAIAEVQPSIGSHVVVASFTPTRQLTILDLGSLDDVFHYFDIFHPEFAKASDRLTCLRMIEQEMSLPLQPTEDTINQVPTQVLAEYVYALLGLDGLAYRSTQTGKVPSLGQLYGARLHPRERNIVLFGTAAVTTSETSDKVPEPGLRFLRESRQLVDITQIKVCYEQNFQASYAHSK